MDVPSGPGRRKGRVCMWIWLVFDLDLEIMVEVLRRVIYVEVSRWITVSD
jgi:hypothetical protein